MKVDPNRPAPPSMHKGCDALMEIQTKLIHRFLHERDHGADEELWWRGFLAAVASTIESQLGAEKTIKLLKAEAELTELIRQREQAGTH